jgi:hypothetical protein
VDEALIKNDTSRPPGEQDRNGHPVRVPYVLKELPPAKDGGDLWADGNVKPPFP